MASGGVNGEEKKNKNADDTVQKSIDGTKQIKRKQEACWARDASKGHTVYAVPHGSQFCKSGIGILQKGEVIP
ncbi:hypothetical protein T11_16716, partial [Trichinella zimbabwensis]